MISSAAEEDEKGPGQKFSREHLLYSGAETFEALSHTHRNLTEEKANIGGDSQQDNPPNARMHRIKVAESNFFATMMRTP